MTIFLILVSQAGTLRPVGWPVSRYKLYSDYIGWSWCIGSFVAQNILILRTYALCNRNKYLISILILIHAGCNVGVWVIDSQFLVGPVLNIENNALPNTSLAAFAEIILSVIDQIRNLWRVYLIIFLDETVIVVITIVYIFRAGGYKYTTLIWTIWRDGIAFYVCLQGLSMFNIFFIRFGSTNLYYLPMSAASLHRVMHSILTARMLLNLRRAALPEQGREGISSTSGDPSMIQFGLPVLSSNFDFSECLGQASTPAQGR